MYKRKNKYNKIKSEVISKLEKHLKKVDELHVDKRKK